MSHKIKWGVIGCGTVAGYGHLPSIHKHTDVELYAIAEMNPKRLHQMGEQFGVEPHRRFTDYRELLSLPELEAVTVSTRVEQHHEVVMEAANAKKHILCEKPIAPDVDAGWEMVKAAEQNGVHLVINLHNRIKTSMNWMLEHLRQEKIGKLHTIRMVYLWYGPQNEASADNTPGRRDFLMEQGGGPIFDCGVHFFDMVRLFSQSEYRDISATGRWVEEQYSNPGHVIARCLMENGVMVLVEESWLYTHKSKIKNVVHRMELIGSDGVLVSNWDWDPKLEKYHGDRVQLFSKDDFQEAVFDTGKPFDGMYHYCAELIRTGQSTAPLATGKDGILAMQAALRALNDCKK